MFCSRQDKTLAENKVKRPADSMTKPAKRIKSQELFQQLNEVEIDHEGRIYRLRLTQFNKLILTA